MYFYYKMYTICKLFYNTFISFQELCMSLRFYLYAQLTPSYRLISAIKHCITYGGNSAKAH